jgi:adenosylhomocysteine nucleosidase
MNVVVLISANAEWRALRALLPNVEVYSTPMGESFVYDSPSAAFRFFHGGWGKISAAATTQYVIDHFTPDLLVNLGTCGGFAGRIEVGTIILAERTLVYDIIEQMGDATEAIAHYGSDLDLGWLPQPDPYPVRRGILVSADRDIVVEDIPALIEQYDAVAADWESGAIAWVAKKNNVRCLILRGVTDLVGADGGEAYGKVEIFRERTQEIMRVLFEQFLNWIPETI